MQTIKRVERAKPPLMGTDVLKMYPNHEIPPKHPPIKKECRWCSGTDNLMQDPRTKDWWHADCHDKIRVISSAEAMAQIEGKQTNWGRNYKKKGE
jgi:hypothetical protein